jgi:hypothetical protein
MGFFMGSAMSMRCGVFHLSRRVSDTCELNR